VLQESWRECGVDTSNNRHEYNGMLKEKQIGGLTLRTRFRIFFRYFPFILSLTLWSYRLDDSADTFHDNRSLCHPGLLAPQFCLQQVS